MLLAKRPMAVIDAYQRLGKVLGSSARSLVQDASCQESVKSVEMKDLPMLSDEMLVLPPAVDEAASKDMFGFRAMLRRVRFMSTGAKGRSAIVFVVGPSNINIVIKQLQSTMPDDTETGPQWLQLRLGVAALVLSQDEAIPEGLIPPEQESFAGQDLFVNPSAVGSSAADKKVYSKPAAEKEWRQGVEIGFTDLIKTATPAKKHVTFRSSAETRILL